MRPSDKDIAEKAANEVAEAREFLRKMNIVSTKSTEDDDKDKVRGEEHLQNREIDCNSKKVKSFVANV